jgi:hypothetical protein
LVDEIMGVLGVGVAPFVGNHIIGGDTITVISGGAVPVGVGAVDGGIVVYRPHFRPGSIIGVAPKGIGEETIGITTVVDDVLLVLVECTGEEIAFLPHLVASVLFIKTAEKSILTGRDAVDGLAGMGIDVDKLAHATTVGYLYFVY